jgi:thioredoxin-dependent peroxiredoxin
MKIGNKCPIFKGKDQNGNTFDISEILGKKNIIIYFYPKNETKVCTAQACSFRDNYETFKDHECEVIGISGDNEKSHQSFTKNHSLPFILLSDGDKSIRKLFDVPKVFLGLIPGRYTYIVDKNGVIVEIYHDMLDAESHTKKALETIDIKGF